MLMKALDTLHVSAVGPDNIRAGQTFEIADADGEILRQRGLAEPVEAQPEAAKPARTRAK
ncbi:hypothetical protein [Sphingomonas sp. C3-2]|uniref:hypothetical protein n=1 Tax=Sphingomonas sp. C3-2 TaxID=3062169 RepID=UPI00294ADEE7|nr:hypothetical protein [Sphingomonas sp. C3-2]WOK37569.1 hypothetical protein QYC26_05105 [Sphingomonas sp. C3-2]